MRIMQLKILLPSVALVLALAEMTPLPASAQTTAAACTSSNVSENFTQAGTNCTWNWIGGACLTAAPTVTHLSPGPLPQCIGSDYYGSQTQYGGNSENSGKLNTNPDTPLTGGALRLTNDADNQAGAIISTSTFNLAQNGVFISFTTETYEGDSGGTNKDGADGISFFLQDASQPVTLGDFGGSLGYTCSNSNNSSTQGYDGMVGGYIGLGIDEYGNFLNGTFYTNTTGATPTLNSTTADNTSTGYGYVPNRIGLRGAGSTAWYTLSKILDPSNGTAYYPSTLTSAQQIAAVRQACQSGYVWDYRNATSTVTGPTSPSNNGNVVTFANPYSATKTTTTLPNYAAIPNAYTVLTAHKIANEAALYRGYANAATSGTNYGVPITYNLSITPPSGTVTTPLLSLSYSYNGGNFLPIISGQAIPATNGVLPAQVRFGFAGSTGGSRNIHEIMCFTAEPQNSASSSAGLNQKQSAKVQTGTQVYFAFYNSNNWTGDVTSQFLDTPPGGGANDLQIDPIVNWSASCNLTGGPCAKTGGTVTAQDPDSGRVILSWNPATSSGVAFKYANLSTGEQSSLDFGDSGAFPPSSSSRVEFLRGSRADEQNPQGADPNTPTIIPSGFRKRTSVLGDIVDSSPTWVGPPQNTYPAHWRDTLNTGMTMPENYGQSYATFQSTYLGRTNVVYTGANDGLLHGFRSGNFATGPTAGTMTFQPANNDGSEVIAYMPGYVVNNINSSTLANTLPATSNPVNDYSSPLYAHKFNVDGTPGSGDLYYGGAWHTWLIGGLGTGGSAIYALDITDPDGTVSSTKSFSESNASSIVLGEWQSAINYSTTTNALGVTSTAVTGGSSNITCAGNGTAASTCGNSLGKTFGTPLIRRFHNDPTVGGGPNTSWGAVFGNGGGSFNGDAGIFIMMVNASSTGTLQAPTFYYLSTGVGSNYVPSATPGTYTASGNSNGIYYVAAADLDGDHITDYIYAGDLQGNIWRFDVTSTNPANWSVTKVGGVPTPLYTTAGGKTQPITTQPVVVTVASTPNSRVLVEFGTGQQTQFTNSSSATYSSSQQAILGVWDWNMAAWNASSTTQYASLPSGSIAAPTSPISGLSQMQNQTITGTYDSTGAATSASNPTYTTSSGAYYRTISANVVCWAGTAGCTGGSAQYGWSLALATGYANSYDSNYPTPTTSVNAQMVYEQVIFSPTYQQGALQVNTTVPPTSSVATCSGTSAGGWTMAINPATGGAFASSYFATGSSAGNGSGGSGTGNRQFLNVGGSPVTGIALNGTGSASDVVQGTQAYLVTQTINGVGALVAINPPNSSGGKRLTWIQKR
jgi:type IV pilus assembly protein PilY1